MGSFQSMQMVTGHKDKKGDFHPHASSSGGVSENDMKISVKGNNDVITVQPKLGVVKSKEGILYGDSIRYENRDYTLIAKNIDENGAEAFFDDLKEQAKKENPKARITIEKSLPIENKKLPQGKTRGFMITVGDVLQGGELMVLGQYWIFENKQQKYDIAKI